jgi:hypothetical protein
MNIYINEFDSFIKIGFVQFIFSSLESGLRINLRALDSSACNNATAKFKSIYECLLRSKLAGVPPGSIDLLDLFRCIRNTIHNNGVFYNRSGNDEQVVYNGSTYCFIYGKAVNFVTWDFIISIVHDLIDLVVVIVCDPNVVLIMGTIQDPFAQK